MGRLIVDQVMTGFDEAVKEQIISYLHPQETQKKVENRFWKIGRNPMKMENI